MADRYFKKPNGVIIKMHELHNLDSLKERFKECDINGKLLNKTSKKATKKGDK